VVWDEPDAAKGRDLLSAPRPTLPQWVADQGLTLSVTVSFAVAPDGVVAQARIARSSGYSDVDAAVLEAVRRWRFRAAETTQTVRGTIAYTIRAR
jgi:protein TonB